MDLKFNSSINIDKLEGETLKEAFREIKRIYLEYIDTSSENADFVSLWALASFFHNQFDTFPILAFNAQKRSGKTRSMKLLKEITDGKLYVSMTEANLFRHPQNKPMFLDELENLDKDEKKTLKELLNSVYKKGVMIPRSDRKDKDGKRIQEEFSVWFPMSIANISGYDGVLGDRALHIVLLRSKNMKTKLIEDFDTNKDIIELKSKLKRLSLKIPSNLRSEWNRYFKGKEVSDKSLLPLFDTINKTNISSRQLELLLPLFVISYICDYLNAFIPIAVEYSEKMEEEDMQNDLDEQLKKFILGNIGDFIGYVLQKEIRDKWVESMGEEEYRWITSKRVGSILRRLDMIADRSHTNGRTTIRLKPLSPNSLTTLTTTTTPTTLTTTPTPTTTINSNIEVIKVKG